MIYLNRGLQGGAVMSDKEIVFTMRKRVFDDWRYRRLTWQEVKAKYGFSKAWFYKFKNRFLRYGDEGLKDKKRKAPQLAYYLDWSQKLKILDYIYNNPTHGPLRISMNMPFKISGKSVWKYLVRENLHTRRKRRLWAESQGKPTLTEKEKLCRQARKRHVESHHPGELVSMDTFTASVKGLGKIWQYTACDTYSSYGWAKLYTDRNAGNSSDFLTGHIIKSCPAGKIKRVLTDQGAEFYSAAYRCSTGAFGDFLGVYGVKHVVTRKAHPWTNGYAERLNQTIWQEFYLCRLSRAFTSIDELDGELQIFMRDYNFKRMHTGYKLTAGGYKFPAHAFFDTRESRHMIEVPC
jgi:transposase InsO family protein